MQHLSLILATLGLIAWLSRGSAPHPSRVVTGFVVLSAVVATWSLGLGMLSIDPPTVLVVVLFPVTVAITAVAVRRAGGNCVGAASVRRDPKSLWVIPGVFIVIAGWVALGGPVRRMQWVLLQWDATSNPGVAATTRALPAFDFMPEVITGWELYPRGSHAVAGMFATAGSFGVQSFSESTLVGFYSTVWVVYGLLILAAGIVAIRVARLLHGGSTGETVALVLAQSVFVTPFLVEHLLLMHSLSFMCSLLAVLFLAILVLDDVLEEGTVTAKQRIVGAVATFVVVANSYPILLPLVILMAMALFIPWRQRHRAEPAAVRPVLLSVGALAALSVSVTALITYQDRVAASASFQQGGQLIPVPFGWLASGLGLAALGLGVLLVMRRWTAIVALLAVIGGAVLVPAVMWAIVGNLDRSFGVNYYPKKAEYVTLVVVVPVAAGCIAVIVERLLRPARSTRVVERVVLSLVVLFAGAQVVRGSFEYLVRRSGGNTEAASLLEAALSEAQRPGMSIVFDYRRPDLSVNSSLLSNYVDESFWSHPNSQTSNFVLAQQLLGIQPNQPLTDFCRFINSPEHGPGRIQEMSTGSSITCR